MPISLTRGSSLKAQHCHLALFFSALSSPSSEGSLFHWVHHRQGRMEAFFSAFWYQQAGRGFTPWPPEKLWTWCTELRIAHFLGTLTLGTMAWEQGQCLSRDLYQTGVILNCCTLSLGCWQQLALLWSQRFSWEPLLVFFKFKILRDTFLSLLP